MIFNLLITIVVLSPLPFASVYPWSRSLIALAVGLLVIAWSIENMLKGRQPVVGLRSMWPFALFFAVAVGWAGLQTLSALPGEWHASLWRQASEVLGMPLGGAVSVNPEATATALMGLLSYAGVFWLSLQYCRKEKNASRVIKTMVLSGFLYALYGLWVVSSGSKTILWFDKFAYIDDLTSTFVNRNSYATFAGLGLVCATGLIIRLIAETIIKPFRRSERLRQLIEALLEQGWFLLLAWMTIMMALLMSHSRAGFISTILSLIVLGFVLSFSKGMRLKYTIILCGLSLAIISVFFVFAGEELNQRYGLLFSGELQRPVVYGLIIEAIKSQPWLGTGYGTFAEVFTSIRGPDLYKEYLKAHNTYLENAFELGLPAAISLFGIFAGFLILNYRGIRSRQVGSIYPCIGFSATALVTLHSLVDFSLQIPAVALTYSLIMGAACGQSWSTRKPPDPW